MGLLDRTINLMGDSSSDNDKFGGHVIIRGTAQVEGVRTYRMGQLNMLARYPLHFHMVGDGSGMYFRDNAIEKSYFRCAVVHGTNSTLLSRNVAFNNFGHCYYLEDGVEEQNTFEFNLAVYTRTIGAPSTGGSTSQSDDVIQTS